MEFYHQNHLHFLLEGQDQRDFRLIVYYKRFFQQRETFPNSILVGKLIPRIVFPLLSVYSNWNLSSETLSRNVKIHILSCFGDIALAIGPAFEPYLEATMNVLRQAGVMMPNPVSFRFVEQVHFSSPGMILQLDIELVEYVTLLREGILEAFTGIVTGFKDTDKGLFFRGMHSVRSLNKVFFTATVGLIGPYVQTILDICQRAMADQERTENTAKLVFGLVGDLASAFPNGEIKQLLLNEWLAGELRVRRYSGQTKQVQKWAREVSRCRTVDLEYMLIYAPLATARQACDGLSRLRFLSSISSSLMSSVLSRNYRFSFILLSPCYTTSHARYARHARL